jgi:hypothetical protein
MEGSIVQYLVVRNNIEELGDLVRVMNFLNDRVRRQLCVQIHHCDQVRGDELSLLRRVKHSSVPQTNKKSGRHLQKGIKA